MKNNNWNEPPSEIILHNNDVHIWKASLNVNSDKITTLKSILSNDEIDKADRFVFGRDQRRFIVARGLLRIILGRYLMVKPKKIKFIYNDYGKPALSYKFHKRKLHFNISHSNELVVFAITNKGRIGIDIENVHSMKDIEQIIERFFSIEEQEEFKTLPKYCQEQVFFKCWTRKEAFIKACGQGLTLPLNKFTVSVIPSEPARLKYIDNEIDKVDSWTMKEVIPIAGYVGTVVVEGNSYIFHFWNCK